MSQLPLSLHIPEPKARPGQVPDFSGVPLSAAGAVPRPAIDSDESVLRRYPYELIRVLDDAHHAVGDWLPTLDTDHLLRGLRAMLLTRTYDERMVRLQRQGKTSFYMKCTGEEAVAVAQAMALDSGDMLFPSYRQQGLLIARDHSLLDMMCQVLNNRRDRLKGRQLPVMYSSRASNFFRYPATSARSFRKRSAGRWHRRSAVTPVSRPHGSVMAPRPKVTFTMR